MSNASEFYGVFLIVEMGRDMGIFDRELETDLTWEQASALYEEYEGSEFDDKDKGEYMCIHDFMLTKKFNPIDALHKLYAEFDGQEFSGLIFNHCSVANEVYLTFPKSVEGCDLQLHCGAFLNENEHSIQFDLNIGGEQMEQAIYGVEVPTDDFSFEAFKGIYTKHLCEVISKLARVKTVELDVRNKTYTVEGHLVPKQTISFDDYSDWNYIKGFNGVAIQDCQIDFDEGFQFQLTTLNYDSDSGTLNQDGNNEWFGMTNFKFTTVNDIGFDVAVDFGDEIGSQTVGSFDTIEEANEMVQIIKSAMTEPTIGLSYSNDEWQGTVGDIKNVWCSPTDNPPLKTWEYNLNSNVVYGSFDYGEVEAETEEEAIKLAKAAINKEVEEMNDVLVQSAGGQSLGVDVDSVEVKLKK